MPIQKRMNKHIIVILLMLVCAVFSSCIFMRKLTGEQNSASDIVRKIQYDVALTTYNEIPDNEFYGINGSVYTPNSTIFKSDVYNTIYTVTNDHLYYMVNEQSIAKVNLLGDGEEEILPIDLTESGDIRMFTVSPKDELWMVTTSPKEKYYFLIHYNQQGELLSKGEFKLSHMSEYAYPVKTLCVDGQDRVYLLVERCIYLMDRDGKTLGQITFDSFDDPSIIVGSDRQVYVMLANPSARGYWLCQVDYETSSFTPIAEGFNHGLKRYVVTGVENEILIATEATLYSYNFETMQETPLLRWIDSDISIVQAEQIYGLSDGSVAIFDTTWDGDYILEMVRLTKRAAKDMPKREFIHLGVRSYLSDAEKDVIAFNQSNQQYRVIVHGDSSYEVDNVLGKRQEWLSPNTTDVIQMDLIEIEDFPYNITTYPDALTDLSVFMQSDAKFERDDYVESLLKAYTFNNRLMCIPSTFSIEMLVGKTSVIGDRSVWTLDDMILLQKKYPDREFLVTAYDSWDMLPLLMSANLSEFVDLNTFQCNFDSEIFKKTLELSKLYQTTKEYYSSSETLEQLIADEIVLFSESFDSINDFVRTKEDAMEEQLTYIGYPTTDGSIGANIRGESGMYGISANSQNKDGAWAFIEFGLEESLDPDPQKIGAKLPALQGWLDVIILGALLSDTHDIELDDVEFIRTVIREAKPIMPVADFSVAMESTIQSEAEYFYTGVYSVDQTADNIQNKAQKLMDEIRAK